MGQTAWTRHTQNLTACGITIDAKDKLRVNTSEIVQELIRAGAALVLQGSPGTTMRVAHIVDSHERTRRCDC